MTIDSGDNDAAFLGVVQSQESKDKTDNWLAKLKEDYDSSQALDSSAFDQMNITVQHNLLKDSRANSSDPNETSQLLVGQNVDKKILRKTELGLLESDDSLMIANNHASMNSVDSKPESNI